MLLSAAAGRYASGEMFGLILERFRLSQRAKLHPEGPIFHAAKPCAGAIYTYRPKTHIFASGRGYDRHPWILLLLLNLATRMTD